MSGTAEGAAKARAAATAQRWERVAELHAILSASSTSRTTHALAREMGVSRRSITNYMRDLRERGLAEHTGNGRYRASGVDTMPL